VTNFIICSQNIFHCHKQLDGFAKNPSAVMHLELFYKAVNIERSLHLSSLMYDDITLTKLFCQQQF